MKVNLKKMLGLAALGLMLLAATVPTWAGLKLTEGVTVINDNGIRRAYGSMVGARYSKDSTQYIACDFANGLGPSVSCYAQDKTGKRFYCNSFDPRWATVVKAITDSSVISFGGYIGGACTSLVIENHSSHLR
jgi:hypothetical protein